jgi:SPOR domain
MSVSGSRSAEINLEEFERRLRAAGAQPAGLEDPLFELARLVEGSWPEPANALSSASAPRLDVETPQRLETGALRPELDGLEDYHDEIVDSSQASDVEQPVDVHDVRNPEPVQKRRSGGWTLRVVALAVVGLAMIGAVFALRGGVPGLAKQPPFIAAAQGPTKVQPPSEETVAGANDAGANLLKDSAQPEHVKVVASEEQPVDLNAQGTPVAAPAIAPTAPADPGAAAGSPMKGIGDAPVVVTLPAGQPPVAQQFPDPKPVRTVSLRPDGTPIPPSMVATAGGSDTAPPSEAPRPLAKPATKPVAESAGSAQPSTPKLDVPTKLSGKSSARVAVAKTDTTASAAPTDIQNDPVQQSVPTKSEKPAKAPKIQQAAAETGSPAATTPAAVEAPAATSSTGWAVQLAAPKSEAEAKSTAARLGSKYESVLNGSPIEVHKAVVNGETIYRLRVVGLSKADAAALCARLKGDGGDCFIAK